ncbi:lipopolysaccharide biosynthesis protein [Chlamydiota bacterium]
MKTTSNNSLRVQIIKNSLFGWIKVGTIFITGFITVPLLITHLGKEAYGLWCLLASLVGYFTLFDMGITSSLTRLIPKYLARGDQESINHVVSTALLIYLVISLLIIGISVFFSGKFISFFCLSGQLQKVSKLVFIIIGVGTAVIFPLRCGNELLYALRRYDIVSQVFSIESLVRLAFIVIMFRCGFDNLISLALIVAGSSVFAYSVLMVISWKKMSGIKLSIRKLNKDLFKQMSGLSVSAFITTNSVLICNNIFIVLVAKLFTEGKILFIAIPLLLVRYGGALINQVTQVIVPAASRMHEENERKRLEELTFFGIRFSLLSGITLFLFFIFSGKLFFSFWLRRALLDLASIQVLKISTCIILGGFLVSIAHKPCQMVARSVGKHWFVAGESFISSLIGISVACLLTLIYNRGLYGIAVGYCTAHVIKGLLYIPITRSFFNLSIGSYVYQAYVRVLAASCCIFIFFHIKALLFSEKEFYSLLISLIGMIGIFILSFYVCCLTKKQKQWVNTFLKRSIFKKKKQYNM